ncbi:MAG: patatin-like phospholipase family protein [Clostridia bacterium]|nr:patatin-like phospholipase family protein [Clostridia bacterium]
MSERKKVGLALASGGGRGIAHIGVLQVLTEHKVPIDLISGCSAGALVAAIYAAGTDLYMLEKYLCTLVPKDIIDPTVVTRGGFLSGNKVSEIVRTLTHDLSVNETKIPCFIGAADLETSEFHIFEDCKLYEAARASMAIPGVFTPVRIDGHWYIDGGTLQELPVEVLRDHGADVVIGVDLSIKKRFTVEEDKVPGAHSSLLRAFSIMQKEITRIRADRVDVRIKPDVSFMGMISTAGAEEAIRIGRACAERAMPEIEALLG